MPRDRKAARHMSAVRYPPISEYGIIGDCRTAALVSSSGSIDWFCLPRFDSPTLFARILDWSRGGHFSLHIVGASRRSRRYVPGTNILETEFRTPAGRATLYDFMPKYQGSAGAPVRIVRLVRCAEGTVDCQAEFAPRPDYARRPPQLQRASDHLYIHQGDPEFALYSSVPLQEGHDELRARFRLAEGQQASFVIQAGPPDQLPDAPELASLLTLTEDYWREWAGSCSYRGQYRDAVVRSTLVLKLLSYEPSGSLVAAPTTSLPEHIGGGRNWDYRFTWLRDAALAADALYLLGLGDFQDRFLTWVCDVVQACRTDLQVMYTIDGGRHLPEEVLDHLEGYRGSRPVRVGNAASRQLQLDVYGEVIDCVHICRQHGAEDALLWQDFRALVDWVCRNWRQPDSGIWEMRGEPRHRVLSKAMCWAALDRGIRAASALGLQANLAAWGKARMEIKEDVLRHGFDRRLNAFVQAYGHRQLDAANLLLPVIGFIDARDPRMEGTVAQVKEHLMTDGLVYRYLGADDGVGGPEGSFLACSFWLVDCLALQGKTAEARSLFESLLRRSNDLGLLSEQIDPASGEFLGNFPQALSHIGLLNSALRLGSQVAGPDRWRS